MKGVWVWGAHSTLLVVSFVNLSRSWVSTVGLPIIIVMVDWHWVSVASKKWPGVRNIPSVILCVQPNIKYPLIQTSDVRIWASQILLLAARIWIQTNPNPTKLKLESRSESGFRFSHHWFKQPMQIGIKCIMQKPVPSFRHKNVDEQTIKQTDESHWLHHIPALPEKDVIFGMYGN